MSDIYKIAVNLSMTSNVAGVLSALSHQVTGLHVKVKDLEKGFGRLHLAIGGAFAFAAGSAILAGMKSLTDQARHLNHELANTANFSKNKFSSLDIQAQALTTARATIQKVAGVPIDKALEIFNDSYSIVGAKNATAINETLARYAMVAGGSSGNYDGAFDSIRELLKSGEMSGKIMDEKTHLVDQDRMVGYLDMAAKVSAATDGRVNAKTLFALAQQGGPGLKGLSDEGMMGMLMASQQMGGFRVGTATMSLFSQFAAGKMSGPVADRLEHFGLVGKHHKGQGGGVVFDKGGLDTAWIKELLKSPLDAIASLRKALEAKGITGEDQTKEMFSIFGRQTTMRLMGDFMTNMESMIAERGRVMNSKGFRDQDANRNENDYDRNLVDVTNAWKNLMAEIGLPLTFKAIGVMHELTGTFNSMSAYVAKMDPARLQAIGTGIAILGASLVAAGGVAMIAALGPAGWIVLGIGGILGAIEAYDPKAMEQFVADMKQLMSVLGTLFGWIGGVLSALKPKGGPNSGADLGDSMNDMIPQRESYTGGGRYQKMSYSGSYDGPGGVSRTGGSMYDAIMRAEIPNSKHPYSETLGYGAYGNPGDLTKMTLDQVYAASEAIRHNPRNRTNAGPMGAFQILGSTMKAAAKALGYDLKTTKFDEYHQQAMASWIASHQGLGAWEGLKVHPNEMARARAAGIPRPRAPIVIHNHNTTTLDGRVVAKSVTKHQANMAYMPNAIGTHDSFGSYFPPGGQMVPT